MSAPPAAGRTGRPVGGVVLRVVLAVALLVVGAFGWTLAEDRAGCAEARAAVTGARVDGGPGLAAAVRDAERSCADGGDRLLLVQALLEEPRPAPALARAVAARAVAAEPDRYETRQAGLLVARDGPEREAAIAALVRLDPRLAQR